jgi:hypothetical protein
MPCAISLRQLSDWSALNRNEATDLTLADANEAVRRISNGLGLAATRERLLGSLNERVRRFKKIIGTLA